MNARSTCAAKSPAEQAAAARFGHAREQSFTVKIKSGSKITI